MMVWKSDVLQRFIINLFLRNKNINICFRYIAISIGKFCIMTKSTPTSTLGLNITPQVYKENRFQGNLKCRANVDNIINWFLLDN